MPTSNNYQKAVSRKFFSSRGIALFLGAFVMFGAIAKTSAQETPPAPSEPRESKIPPAVEKTLLNGMRVIVINRPNVPLVSARLLINSAGSYLEEDAEIPSGIADFTATLLTKGTRTRNATKISEEIEFLGANLNASANYGYTAVDVSSMSDKFPQVLAIMADVVKNPTFSNAEIERLRQQTIDDLNIQFKQPNFLARQTAQKVIVGDSPTSGTLQSIASLNRRQIGQFYKDNYDPSDSILIIVGDIEAPNAFRSAQNTFGNWRKPPRKVDIIQSITERATAAVSMKLGEPDNSSLIIKRLIVVDLPSSGQAAVTVGRRTNIVVGEPEFYTSRVYNSILGEGFTSRLNQEIRIKRGLTYGAGSSFLPNYLFLTRTQTKNETAAEVAELVLQEIYKMSETTPSEDEMKTRKAVAIGSFNNLAATNNGLISLLSELVSNNVELRELNAYISQLQSVTANRIQGLTGKLNNLYNAETESASAKAQTSVADNRLRTGRNLSLIIVGDAKTFLPKLEEKIREKKIVFHDDYLQDSEDMPDNIFRQIEVIPANELDLDSNTLRRRQ